jgi:hypothetical protein
LTALSLVCCLGSAAAGPAGANLIQNGSFEISTAPEMPDCWANHILYPAFDADFYENFRAVEDNPFHGQRCFRLKGSATHYGQTGLFADRGTNGVLSLYLRTDTSGATIRVNGSGETGVFTPDRDWKRFVLPIRKLTASRFSVSCTNTVFLDAVKLEPGGTPTSFAPHTYERLRSAVPPSETVPPPSAALPPPVVTSAREIPWGRGLAVQLAGEGGTAPRQTTRCAILRDDAALRVRFQCAGRDPGRLVARVTEPASGLLAADDAVAVCLTPGHASGSDTRYAFIVNAAGTRGQSRKGDPTWRATWEAEVVTNATGYEARLTIPYAVLDEGLFLGPVWRVNLIRYAAAGPDGPREVTAWSFPKLAIAEHDGAEVSGFDGLGRYRVHIATPRALLAERRLSALRPDLFDVVFRARFAERGALRGNAVLTTARRRLETVWQRTEDTADMTFTGLTPREVTELGDMTLQLRAAGTVLAERFFRDRLAVPPLAEVGPLDRNYYSTETCAAVRVAHAVAPAFAKGLEWDLHVLRQQRSVFSRRYAASERDLALPLENLAPGEYALRVNLVRGNGSAEILAGRELMLTRLPPGKTESKYDPVRRLPILAGKPFVAFGADFPTGSLKHSPDNAAALHRLAREELPQRFANVIMTLGAIPSNGMSAAHCDHLERFLDACRDGGLPVFVWLSSNIDMTPQGAPSSKQRTMYELPAPEIIRMQTEEVRALAHRPEIAVWKSMDEVYGHWLKLHPDHRESDLLTFRHALKEVDPHRLYWENSVYAGRMFGGYDSADVITASLYGTGSEFVLDHMRLMEAARERAGRRNVTGAWLVKYPRDWECLRPLDELRCSVYAILTTGGRWVSFYTCKSFSRSVWDGLVGLKREIDFLTPVFSGEEVTGEVRASHSQLAWCAWRYGGKTYLLAANVSPRPLAVAAFDVAAVSRAKHVRVCFENRTLQSGDGVIRDAFPAYGRHVYEWE